MKQVAISYNRVRGENMAGDNDQQFRVIRSNKFSQQINRQLLEAIVAGRYRPGDLLPSERDLATMFQASRIAVREALGSLAAKGIVSVRHGKGTTVNAMDEWNTLDPVVLMLCDGYGTFDQLQEVRRIIEPELAALAAARITPEALEILRPLADLPLDDTMEQHVERDTNFHLAIAQVTGNTVLVIVLSSIGDLLRESRRRSFCVSGELARAREWHHVIFAAIERRDPDAAREAMAQHMLQVKSSLEGYNAIEHHENPNDNAQD